MKGKKLFVLLFILATLGAFPDLSVQDELRNTPQAFLPVVRDNFPTVLEGTEVLCDFIMQNKGYADLELKEIQTG